MEAELLKRRKQVLEELMDDKQYVPMKIKRAGHTSADSQREEEELKEVLDRLLGEGKIEVSKRENTKSGRSHINGQVYRKCPGVWLYWK